MFISYLDALLCNQGLSRRLSEIEIQEPVNQIMRNEKYHESTKKAKIKLLKVFCIKLKKNKMYGI